MKIEFRAKKDDMSDCRFVYGSLIFDKEGNPRIQEDRNFLTFTSCLKNTEGQFIGLPDKNMKKIYVGDIIMHQGLTYKIMMLQGEFIGCGIGKRAGFYRLQNGMNRVCEIIGNIHEPKTAHL